MIWKCTKTNLQFTPKDPLFVIAQNTVTQHVCFERNLKKFIFLQVCASTFILVDDQWLQAEDFPTILTV